MDLHDWVREYDFESDEDDRNVFCWGEGDDYTFCMSTKESESDDDEVDRNRMPQVGTGINDATILGDEKQKSEVSGTRMDTKLIFHDGDKMDLSIQDEASDWDDSEEDLSIEMKKKMEKRKSREDGFESEQNDSVEAAVEVKKKKKKSIRTSVV
ncbi:hypothetical protein MKW98_006584 [Papaver atlanticum]|uniref:Uncharacterized protein n=1 Tax=Papaver atlanticum TaxID=357466 RepID=A0AAD4T9P0_9MAGN|nr:hypothetical protein MKW98_006584 [Papaver atlanticum]